MPHPVQSSTHLPVTNAMSASVLSVPIISLIEAVFQRVMSTIKASFVIATKLTLLPVRVIMPAQYKRIVSYIEPITVSKKDQTHKGLKQTQPANAVTSETNTQLPDFRLMMPIFLLFAWMEDWFPSAPAEKRPVLVPEFEEPTELNTTADQIASNLSEAGNEFPTSFSAPETLFPVFQDQYRLTNQTFPPHETLLPSLPIVPSIPQNWSNGSLAQLDQVNQAPVQIPTQPPASFDQTALLTPALLFSITVIGIYKLWTYSCSREKVEQPQVGQQEQGELDQLDKEKTKTTPEASDSRRNNDQKEIQETQQPQVGQQDQQEQTAATPEPSDSEENPEQQEIQETQQHQVDQRGQREETEIDQIDERKTAATPEASDSERNNDQQDIQETEQHQVDLQDQQEQTEIDQLGKGKTKTTPEPSDSVENNDQQDIQETEQHQVDQQEKTKTTPEPSDSEEKPDQQGIKKVEQPQKPKEKLQQTPKQNTTATRRNHHQQTLYSPAAHPTTGFTSLQKKTHKKSMSEGSPTSEAKPLTTETKAQTPALVSQTPRSTHLRTNSVDSPTNHVTPMSAKPPLKPSTVPKGAKLSNSQTATPLKQAQTKTAKPPQSQPSSKSSQTTVTSPLVTLKSTATQRPSASAISDTTGKSATSTKTFKLPKPDDLGEQKIDDDWENFSPSSSTAVSNQKKKTALSPKSLVLNRRHSIVGSPSKDSPIKPQNAANQAPQSSQQTQHRRNNSEGSPAKGGNSLLKTPRQSTLLSGDEFRKLLKQGSTSLKKASAPTPKKPSTEENNLFLGSPLFGYRPLSPEGTPSSTPDKEWDD